MSDDYTGALLEDIQDKLTRFAEAMADVPSKIKAIETDVSELKADMKVVKAAIVDQSRQLGDHEHRITRLENA